jgi:hypothetical protein
VLARTRKLTHADLAQNHEGGDNEHSSPEPLFQGRDKIPELNSSLGWRNSEPSTKQQVQLYCL